MSTPPAHWAPNPCRRTGFSSVPLSTATTTTIKKIGFLQECCCHKGGLWCQPLGGTGLPQVLIHPRGEKGRGSHEYSCLVFSLWGQRAWVRILARPLETSYSWTQEFLTWKDVQRPCGRSLTCVDQKARVAGQEKETGYMVKAEDLKQNTL